MNHDVRGERSLDLDVDPMLALVAAFRAQLRTVDARAICSPEYVHGIPRLPDDALDGRVSALEPIDFAPLAAACDQVAAAAAASE